MPQQPTLKPLDCHCTYPLMELGINRLSPLLNDRLTHISDRNRFISLPGHEVRIRHIMALSKLSCTLNSHSLTPDLSSTII
eukprot:1140686-Pelagomonas_calceolata.AAC.3